ncbi:MAG: fyuA [Gammaproteobacteria bacterium]|nr:fyuA [Gammaproteobacteria bacterium]
MEISESCSSATLAGVVTQLVRRGRAQRRIISAAAVCATAMLLAPGSTRAANNPSEDTAAGTVDEVVVTATRREERLLDIPMSASALSGAPLEALGSAGQDIRQLAFTVPSLNIESSNGRTFPRFYIRGYGNTDFNSFASQPVSLVYDDVVQENPALKGFPVFDQADVEVLRGPQGTLFGRNSPAGVVKLESAKPVLGQYSGSVSLSDGTYNTADFDGVVNLPINDQLAFRAATQGQHRDNWVTDRINNTHLEGYDDWAARLQLLYKPSDAFNALFNVHGRILNGSARLFRANIIQLGSNHLVAGFDPAQFYGDGYNGQSYSSVGSNVHLTWNLPSVSLQSITGYESILHYNTIGDIDGGYGPGGLVNPAVPSGPGFIPFGVETGGGIKSHYQLTQEFRAVSNLSGPLQGQAGIFLFDEDVKAVGNDYDITGATLVDTTISEQKNNAEAIFGSLEYSFTSALKVRAGVRFTEDHKTFSVPYAQTASGVPLPLTGPLSKSASASNVSWDLSTTYQVARDVNLYARVATGFRAPSFGAPTGTQAIQVAQSENNISYEGGVKADLFEHRARVAFDVFYYDVSHQQLTAVGGNANQTALINAAHTIGQGAELDFEAHPLPNLVVNLSGSFNDTKIKDKNLAVSPCFNWSFISPELHCTITNPSNPAGLTLIDGNPLPQAARWIADVSLRYSLPLGPSSEIYLYTDWSYRSEVDFFLYQAKEFIGPPLAQGGARIGYTWADKKYEVAAFCRNCTNQIRAIGAIDFENTTGMINDPRIVGGQFSVKF